MVFYLVAFAGIAFARLIRDVSIHYFIMTSGPRHAKTCLWTYTDIEGPVQPAHLRSLIRAFTFRRQNHWILQNLCSESKSPDDTLPMRRMIWICAFLFLFSFRPVLRRLKLATHAYATLWFVEDVSGMFLFVCFCLFVSNTNVRMSNCIRRTLSSSVLHTDRESPLSHYLL